MLWYFLFSFALSEITEPTEKLLIKKADGGSQFYRIPAIVLAPDNKTLVTATDKRWESILDLPRKIDVVIQYSEDGGLTWSPAQTITPGKSDPKGYGDPLLIVDRQIGAIFCMFTGNQGTFESSSKWDNSQHLYYCVSYDNGHTWSDMEDITAMLYGERCTDPVRKNYKSLFLSSGNGLQLRSGRLLVAAVVRPKTTNSLSVYVVYSDDHGKTWTMSTYGATHAGDESKLVELNNGSVLMSVRRRPNRAFIISNDGGVTWGKEWNHPEVKDPACNGDLIRYTSTKDGYDKDRLIHTLLYSGTGSADRKNLTIMISYDEGNTWPVKKVIYGSWAIYSSVTFDPATGLIYVYWEKSIDNTVGAGCNMVLTTLTLDWITDGQDTYTPPSPQKQN
ncbi:neuramidase [Tritrichomonas foetus]|uniref:Neuramidase n=1 Tax=Tritrichomonas foetus TaxID=1144522 RepID=A0A1J4K1Z8_9EUKA|nr:neuramidase [Tritrichomonas foetus]|eukprot:OHT05259.1 neuramidase [Tritrichomonas foetus]